MTYYYKKDITCDTEGFDLYYNMRISNDNWSIWLMLQKEFYRDKVKGRICKYKMSYTVNKFHKIWTYSNLKYIIWIQTHHDLLKIVILLWLTYKVILGVSRFQKYIYIWVILKSTKGWYLC